MKHKNRAEAMAAYANDDQPAAAEAAAPAPAVAAPQAASAAEGDDEEMCEAPAQPMKKPGASSEEPDGDEDGEDVDDDGDGVKPKGAADPVAAALTAERQRIRDIEAIQAPGFEAFIAEAKYNPAMNADKVSAIILKRQAEARTKTVQDHAADAQALGALSGNIARAQTAGHSVEGTTVEDALVSAAVMGANRHRFPGTK